MPYFCNLIRSLMRVLMETDSAIVGFDESKKAIIVIWSESPGEKEFTQVYNDVLKAFKIYFVNKLVNDFSKLPAITNFQINFLSNKVIPITYKCGLRDLIHVGNHIDEFKEYTQQVNSSDNDSYDKLKVKFSDSFEKAFTRSTF